VARRLKEGILIVLVAIALVILIALLSYDPADPGWSHTGGGGHISNKGGPVGAWLADVLLYLFGYSAYLLPFVIASIGWLLYKDPITQGRTGLFIFDYFHLFTRSVGFLLTILMGCGLAWIHLKGGMDLPHRAGGIVGDVVGREVISMLGPLGGTLLMIGLFLTGVTLSTGLSWLWLMDTTGRYTLDLCSKVQQLGANIFKRRRPRLKRKQEPRLGKTSLEQPLDPVFDASILAAGSKPEPAGVPEPKASTVNAPPAVQSRADNKEDHPVQEPPLIKDPASEQRVAPLPTVDLLDPPQPFKGGFSSESLELMSRQVELKLRDFGIEVQVVAVHPGPVITRFELQPAPGVKASRISGLANDLARSLSTPSVRVVEVIPGKSVVGLEIPNQQRELVSLRQILSAPEYIAAHSPLTLALGKDIGGKPIVVDLARMPHLLVAGTTGAGKSVALNAMVLSMLYKATAQDVRLLMIDPKMLELSVYEGIPLLLTRVVTDMKDAANALRWCVEEMERRYQLMAALKVRNIGGYNHTVEEAIHQGRPLMNPIADTVEPAEPLSRLPYIVVIIDELADMMITVGKKVEELITRLAQNARASGIHLILATQRPSVDVITGLIKANIPSRIAFQVSSRVDSRTILDQIGAENLLGQGDMLYLPPGTGVPIRVHGAFVSDQEVHKVVEYLKSQGTPDYREEVLAEPIEGLAKPIEDLADTDRGVLAPPPPKD
jgi:DNA segregation ATPase FtsK/SpoIIIE, S-DNA-T family